MSRDVTQGVKLNWFVYFSNCIQKICFASYLVVAAPVLEAMLPVVVFVRRVVGLSNVHGFFDHAD